MPIEKELKRERCISGVNLHQMISCAQECQSAVKAADRREALDMITASLQEVIDLQTGLMTTDNTNSNPH